MIPNPQEVNIEDICLMSELDEDISRICKVGIMIDDDREPVPENNPFISTTRCEVDPATGVYIGQKWE